MPTFTLTGPVPGSAAAATGLQPQTIEPGVPVQVGTNIAAQAATGITPQTPVFLVQPRGDGGDHSMNVEAIGIGGLPTTVTVNLLASYDGGATWQLTQNGNALALFTAGAGTVQVIKNLVAGALYAFSISALTLGGATGVNLNVSLS